MIGVVKLAAMSAVLAAGLVLAMEPARVALPRDRLVIEFEPVATVVEPVAERDASAVEPMVTSPSTVARPIRVIDMSARPAATNS